MKTYNKYVDFEDQVSKAQWAFIFQKYDDGL